MNISKSEHFKCDSKTCHLKQAGTSLQRIKKFCKECSPNFKPKECEGVIINTEETKNFGKCPLHVFRFGKNPHIRGNANPDQRHLIPYKKHEKET